MSGGKLVTAAELRAMYAAGASVDEILDAYEESFIAHQAAAEAFVATVSPRVRAAVIERDGYVCRYCNQAVAIPQLDHVFPRSRGGSSIVKNLVVSCVSCNSAKKDRTPEEWRGE